MKTLPRSLCTGTGADIRTLVPVTVTEIMADFHRGLDSIGGEAVLRTEDNSVGLNRLPKSDVLKYFTEIGSVVIRPSGTEPKLRLILA